MPMTSPQSHIDRWTTVYWNTTHITISKKNPKKLIQSMIYSFSSKGILYNHSLFVFVLIVFFKINIKVEGKHLQKLAYWFLTGCRWILRRRIFFGCHSAQWRIRSRVPRFLERKVGRSCFLWTLIHLSIHISSWKRKRLFSSHYHYIFMSFECCAFSQVHSNPLTFKRQQREKERLCKGVYNCHNRTSACRHQHCGENNLL